MEDQSFSLLEPGFSHQASPKPLPEAGASTKRTIEVRPSTLLLASTDVVRENGIST